MASVIASVKMGTKPQPTNQPTKNIAVANVTSPALPEKNLFEDSISLANQLPVSHKLSPQKHLLLDQIIKSGLNKIGTPYVFGGHSEKGFDCSGFVHYIFGRFNINVPHSSTLLAEAGKPVKRKEFRKGDILIFTGTNSADRRPGHVGIIISKAGDAVIKFVHASSNGGVKISQVEGTNYERRFLEIRRVL